MREEFRYLLLAHNLTFPPITSLRTVSVHVWDYRRLVLSNVTVPLAEELSFSTDRLNVNFSNYSSWHYRSALRKLDSESVNTEIALVQSAIFTDPEDSSGWFYLRWVLSNDNVTEEHLRDMIEALDQLQDLESNCKCK